MNVQGSRIKKYLQLLSNGDNKRTNWKSIIGSLLKKSIVMLLRKTYYYGLENCFGLNLTLQAIYNKSFEKIRTNNRHEISKKHRA
jgi:hypothetical protein